MDVKMSSIEQKKAEKAQLAEQKKAEKAQLAEQKKAEKATIKADQYTSEILRKRYSMYRLMYIETANIIETTGLPIRHQNPPEDITENVAKFIIQNYDNDDSCKWAKAIGKKGDLYSSKFSIEQPPEIKSFTSDGPSSFGPTKKFGVIYFLDMRAWLDDRFVLWRVNLNNDSPEWKTLKMNKKQTLAEQCDEKRRPHISWEKIYPQISENCTKLYEGTFEGIFTVAMPVPAMPVPL